ncbi:MAG: hypothetical protein WCK90_00080 [archaeon]
MNKQGQIAIFVIVAIAVVIIIMGLFLFVNRGPSTNASLSSDTSKVKEYVQQCINQRQIDAIRIVGLQGGYIVLPDNYLDTGLYQVAYGQSLGQNTLPSKEKIAREISSYIEYTSPGCINQDKFFTMDISPGEANVNTTISNGKITSRMIFPISVTKENSTSIVGANYESTVNVRFDEIYSFAQGIVKKQIADSKYIDMTYLSSSKFKVGIVPFDNKTTTFTIIDDSSRIENISYSFQFASVIK